MAQNEPAKQKTQQPILTYLVIFIVGFVSGIAFSAFKLNSGENQVADHQHEQQASKSAAAIG